MILVTCANAPFVPHANTLAYSFLKQYDTQALICIFGHDLNFEMFNDDRVSYVHLPENVPHAYTADYYYFKSASIWYAAHSQSKDFIYLDSRFRVLSRAIDLERYLESKGRFFIQYPHIERLKNKYWTTKRCIEICGGDLCNESSQYMAGLQAYSNTLENKDFISNILTLMNDPDAAGPGCRLKYPDGLSNPCISHRNDQSVLTMLINKYKFDQCYDEDLTSKYGDKQTIDIYLPDNIIKWHPIISLLPR